MSKRTIAVIIASDTESSIYSIVKSILNYTKNIFDMTVFSVKNGQDTNSKDFFVFRLNKFFKNINKYDVVHCHGAIPISIIPIIKILNKHVTIVSTEHDYGYQYFKNTLPISKAIVLRLMLKIGRKLCDVNCYPSMSVIKEIKKNGTGVRNASVVYNGIEDNWEADFLNYKHKVIKPEKRIVVVGNYYYPKGVDYAMYAAKKLPEYEINYFGNVLNGYVNAEGFQYGKTYHNFHFHGSVPRKELLRFLVEKNSIVLLPSRFEVCPLTLFEAISTYNPVVVSEIDPFKEFANSQFAVFFNFSEKESIVRAINKAYLNFNSLSKNGRKYYKANFTDRRMVEDYKRLYSHLMEHKFNESCS